MVDPIPQKIKRVWQHWNIRRVILLSLTLQIFLIFSAPLRKHVRTLWLMSTIWSAYLLADYTANFCVGLISNSQLDSLQSSRSTKTIINTNSDLLAFWAPFLLLHLGGPDTITALALEDNELWLRHLLGFISQVVTAAYVFLLSMPGNILWLPTLLVFFAGMIKYGERTYSLFRGSIDNFREATHGEPNAGPNYPMFMDKYRTWQEAGIPTKFVEFPDHHEISTDNGDGINPELGNQAKVQLLRQAFHFFQKFKGLIADMIFSFSDRNESRNYFHGLNPLDALTVVEVELNFLYEAFYTKFFVVRSVYGFVLRVLAFFSLVSALAIFHSIDKEKNGLDGFDVRVTYALLGGAVALDIAALWMLIFSYHTFVKSDIFGRLAAPIVLGMKKVSSETQSGPYKKFRKLCTPFLFRRWNESETESGPYKKFRKLSTPFLFRRWNESMSRFNLISHCLDQFPKTENPDPTKPVRECYQFGWTLKHWLKEKYLKHFGPPTNPFFYEVWEFIFHELKRKSVEANDVKTTHEICDARGDRVINKDLGRKGESLLEFVDVNEVAFDESLILWHIATELCCTWEKSEQEDQNQSPQFISKLISDYMLYLLIFQYTMISAVAGIGIKRFKDTRAETAKFFKEREGELLKDREKNACKILNEVYAVIKAIDLKGDESKSLLFDGCRLAKELMKLGKDVKWKIISRVWVEMLSFTASNCRPTAHVQQLSKGGELLSLVWLLMVRLGLGKQFQVKEAKLKLIVGNTG